MTTFTGILPAKPFQGLDTRWTKNLDSISENQEAGKAWRTTSAPESTSRTSHLPIDVIHSSRVGTIYEMLYRFIYNRIHVSPQTLALGNVVGVQQRTITVWNAYFVPVTLNSLVPDNAEGITVTGQSDPPIVFSALQEKEWTVAVSTDGPPTIDASLTWNFDGVSMAVTVTGSRLLVWSFFPDWSSGITETLEWKTDVLTGPLGDEQRRQLRLAPRRMFELQLIATDDERRYMDLLSFEWGARPWAIPVWNDVQELLAATVVGDTVVSVSTAGRDFYVGGLLLFRGEDAFTYESAEISAIDTYSITLTRTLQQAWAKGTKIYPLRTARFKEQPTQTRLTDRAVSSSASFLVMETSDWDVWEPSETHQGVPVFRLPPEESENLTQTYERILKSIDAQTSLPAYYDGASLAFTVQSHRWLLYGRSEQNLFRQLLYYLRGAFKSVFVPTHFDDMTLVANIAPTGSSLDINYVGYTQYGNMQPGRRDLMVQLRDGTVFFRRITGSAELGNGQERINVDTAFGVAITPDDVLRISYMARCRLTSDSIEIQHQTDSDGVANSTVQFRSIRDDIDE